MNITNEINTSNMIKLEIEKYLNDNHLSYNNAVRNDLGELVGIGDLIYNKTKELQERVDELEKLHTLGLQALVEELNDKLKFD